MRDARKRMHAVAGRAGRVKCNPDKVGDGGSGGKIVILSACPEDTRRLGMILGGILEQGDIVALLGDLGSGKTALSQGIALGLEVPAEYAVTSPTFTLMNEYPGRIPLYHLDLYRLSGERDLADLGYEEFFYGQGATVIEWAEKILDILPEHAWVIHLSHIGEEEREIEISGRADRLAGLTALLSGEKRAILGRPPAGGNR